MYTVTVLTIAVIARRDMERHHDHTPGGAKSSYLLDVGRSVLLDDHPGGAGYSSEAAGYC